MISISILGIKENKQHFYNILDNTNCDYIHIDIMDNIFVPNNNEYTENYIFNKPTDIHLMVEDVDTYIDKYKNLKPDYITFHLEVKQDIEYLINKIKDLGIKVGISIKPNTDIDLIKPYLKDIDLVLVMSVEPGFGGQKFIDNSTNRINYLYELKQEYNYNYVIEVDGGINDETITKCSNADIKVVGNYITSKDDYQKYINILKDLEK